MSRYILPLDEVYNPDRSFSENKDAITNNLLNYTEYCEEEFKKYMATEEIIEEF